MALAIFEPNLFPYKYPNISQTPHSSYLPAYEDRTDSVPKRRHIKFRSRGITQKKAYDIQNTAKVLNQESIQIFEKSSDIKLPRRKHTTFRTRRKFEIKNLYRFSKNPPISNYPEESIRLSEHGESFKSRISTDFRKILKYQIS
jgi:hypothetical protein